MHSTDGTRTFADHFALSGLHRIALTNETIRAQQTSGGTALRAPETFVVPATRPPRFSIKAVAAVDYDSSVGQLRYFSRVEVAELAPLGYDHYHICASQSVMCIGELLRLALENPAHHPNSV
jgi:hypothetical protein